MGTRVIYPPPPIRGLPNPRGAIRHALNHPLGCDPLHAQLRPGMRVTIALDDISLPLPPMATPDIRQTALEVVLEMLTDHGVDDVHLVIANSLHRKMTEAEMRRMVGAEIHKAFYPSRYYNHDAEDPGGMVALGETRHHEPVRVNRRAAESDLVIYLNINLVPMDGGHKSVTVGLCDYESLKPHHEPQTIRDSDGYIGSGAFRTEPQGGPDGEDRGPAHECVSCGDGAEQPDVLRPALVPGEERGRVHRPRPDQDVRNPLVARPPAGCGEAAPAPPDPGGVRADRLLRRPHRARPRAHPRAVVRAVRGTGEGQCDILLCGIPYISPYNVNSILNPLLVQVMGPGYLFNLYRGKPLIRKGGALILAHPCHDEFDPRFHPSYIEFFHRLLPESRDPFVLRSKYEEEFANNPSYVQMYRDGNAYHGAHPFFMWYWGENGRQHVGRIIVAGAKNQHVPEILGWESAESVTEAISMARSGLGPSAEITCSMSRPS